MAKSVLVALTAVALNMFAGVVMAGEYFEKDGVALRGYDPVSYFTVNKPQQGVAAYAYIHKGSTFWFVSAENRKLFMADPDKYAPQFAGYCAFGVARGGYKVSTQPEAFAVVDGKLYLNYNAEVQKLWQQDVPGYIATAEKKWPETAKTQPKD
jgi:YHS domain-containing protein